MDNQDFFPAKPTTAGADHGLESRAYAVPSEQRLRLKRDPRSSDRGAEPKLDPETPFATLCAVTATKTDQPGASLEQIISASSNKPDQEPACLLARLPPSPVQLVTRTASE